MLLSKGAFKTKHISCGLHPQTMPQVKLLVFFTYSTIVLLTQPHESLAMTDVRNSFGGTYLLARQRPEGIIAIALHRNSKKLDNTKTPSPPSRGS